VSQLPKETVRAILAEESEIPAARAWAARRGLKLVYAEDALTLRVKLAGPPANKGDHREPYLVTAELEDFDVLPPIWRFLDPRTGAVVGPAAYPRPTGSSILHPNGLVCAPWSRLAYQAEGGPHPDWDAPTGWKTPRPPYTHATAIPDMLDRIAREVARSCGRMAPLPPLP
jgi:hypothetical protein